MHAHMLLKQRVAPGSSMVSGFVSTVLASAYMKVPRDSTSPGVQGRQNSEAKQKAAAYGGYAKQ